MTDYRQSAAGHRQAWFGLKRYVKRGLSHPVPHALLRIASRAAPSLRLGRLPAPRGLAEVSGTVDGVTYVMLQPDRCEIAKELYWGKGKRPRLEDAHALETVMHLVRDADVLIDIGAYTGLFSLAATAVNGSLTAHAFEIVPAAADLAEANARRNGVTDRLIVHRIGIGIPGATMLVPTGEGGSAVPSFYSSKLRFDDGKKVRFESLDSLEEFIDPSRDRVVMKIDVEGTEADVLAHGRRFLAAHQPDILCELLHGRADIGTVSTVLDEVGYHAYLVEEYALRGRSGISTSPRFRDWLFTCRQDVELRALGCRTSRAS